MWFQYGLVYSVHNEAWWVWFGEALRTQLFACYFYYLLYKKQILLWISAKSKRKVQIIIYVEWVRVRPRPGQMYIHNKKLHSLTDQLKETHVCPLTSQTSSRRHMFDLYDLTDQLIITASL